MQKKKMNSLGDLGGMVYSTDPDFKIEKSGETVETLPAEKQALRIWLETKHRGGKTASVITGFIGSNEDLESLSKLLKNACGTGGSAKDGGIVIQGDHREKILQWLLKNGYKLSKKAGG